MARSYTLFIDESGEAGIVKVRSPSSPGASPYMTLGGVIVRDEDIAEFHNHLLYLSEKLNTNTLHCSELNHNQKVCFARDVSTLRLRFFGVISKKPTLGWYKSIISGDSKKYYNKCAQYLLERAGLFMSKHRVEPEKLSIVFEEGNFDYQKLRNLILKCQTDPRHPNTKFLKHINAQKITSRKKKDEPALQIADLVAHSLYKCVDKTDRNFHIPEPRYFQELKDKFFKHPETPGILDGGLKLVHGLGDLNLDQEITEAFEQT